MARKILIWNTKEVWYENVDWIFVAQDMEDWQAGVNVGEQWILCFDTWAVYFPGVLNDFCTC